MVRSKTRQQDAKESVAEALSFSMGHAFGEGVQMDLQTMDSEDAYFLPLQLSDANFQHSDRMVPAFKAVGIQHSPI